MIFKTFEDEAGHTSVKVSGIFTSLKEDIQALFSAPSTKSNLRFSDSVESYKQMAASLREDKQAIESYIQSVQSGTSRSEAMSECLIQASSSAKEFANSISDVEIRTISAASAMSRYEAQQKASSITVMAQNKSLSNTKTLITEYNAILSDSIHQNEKNYVSLSRSGLSQQQYLDAVKKSNPQLATYLSGLRAADGTTKGYVGSLIGAEAETIGLEIATTALNAVIGMGIGLIISLLASGIQAFIEAIKNSLKSTEEVISELNEKASELSDKISNASKSFRSLRDEADEIIPRFTELSKRIGKLGTQGSLTNEEYQEFLSLNNQLGDLFPELVSGYDDNGNAILNLSDDVDTLTQSLYDCVEAQRQSAAKEIADTMPEVVENINETVEAYEKQKDAIEENKTELQKFYEYVISGGAPSKIKRQGDYYYSLTEGNRKKYYDALGIKVIKTEVGFKYVFDEDNIEENYNTAELVLDKQIQAIENKISAKKKTINPVVSAWMQTDFLYNDLNGVMQDIADTMVKGLDFSELGLKTEQDVKDYITNNIITPLFNASPEVKDAFENLISSLKDGDISDDEFREKMKELFSKLTEGMDESAVKAFTDTFVSGFNAIGIAGDDFDSVAAGVVENFIDIYSSSKKATDGVKDFKSALSDINNLSDGLDQLDKIYADIFNGEDFDYGSILGNDEFTEAFSGLGESYEEFIKTVANSPNDIKACQSAFDNLVTSYILNSGALDNVTDATRNATVAMLEQMGVSNAAAIVDANLAYQKELLKYTTGDYADMTYEEILQLYNECEAGSVTQQILAELAISKMLVNDNAIRSENDIDQIIALANAANATTESLVKCAEAKALMAKADTYMEYFNSATDPRGKSAAMSQYTYYSNQAKSLLSTGLDYNKIDASQFKASYTGGSNTSSARSSAAKAAEKSASEAAKEETWFEKQYKLHKHLVAMEQEDDEDYYSWLNSAMTQAYNEGILELDDYRKYQEEVFSGLRALFKDYLNDVEHEISMRKNYDGEAKKIISLYKTLISKVEAELQAAYARGLDDTDDYVQELLSKWQGYKDGIKDIQDDIEDNAKDAVDDLIDYVQDMQKQEIEDQKDALDKKLDNLKEFYDKQKEMLEDARDEEKYLDEQAEKRKSVTDIQAELARLEYDNSAWAQKRKAELKDELVDAQKELDEFEKDRALDLALDAIEESYNAQEAQIQAEMDALDAELNNPELMFNKALAAIQTNTGNLYQQMLEFNRKYGTGNDEDVKDKYEEAYKALLEYKELNGEDYNGVTLTNATGYESETGSYDSSKPEASTPTTTTTPKSTTPTTTTTPTLDDATKRKVAAAIWNGGYGWGTGSTRSSRLTEVFGANNGIQALVNKNVGRYDSAPGNSYTYLNMRKKFKGYASGTKNALAGLAQINELGDEAIFQSKDGNTYKLFSGGEKVLNAKATDFLYEFANGGSEILEKVIKSALGGGLFDKISPIINNNEVNMGDIIVQGSATSQTVSEIRREQREAVKYMLTEFQKLNK